MGDVFFTADLHLGHKGILSMCDRPWNTVDEMNEGLVETINSTCAQNSTLYMLGDIAFKQHTYWLQRIKCNKVLIRGNHDKMSQKALEEFTEIVGAAKKHGGVLHRAFGTQQMVLSHYPLHSWGGMHRDAWHIHGHAHGRIAEQPDLLRCDVGVDVWAYQPVPLEVLSAKMSARLPQVVAAREVRAKDFDRRENAARQLAELKEENEGFLRQAEERAKNTRSS